MSAWATTIISTLVLVVAFMQWRTAHQKVMLDLFDRRLEVYRQAWEAVGYVLRHGHSDLESQLTMLRASEKAAFLFGAEVHDYLQDLSTTFLNFEAANKEMEAGATASNIDKRYQLFNKITKFGKDAPALFGPYMRMDQKRVRTPAEWFADRNRIRQSYADEKQK